MIVIYAEKPDVGKKIAAAIDAITLSSGKRVSFNELDLYEKAIKAQQFRDGFLEIRFGGERTYVTWGYGHLCELKSAKDYNTMYQHWQNIPVPFIPDSYEIKVKDGVIKQFNLVKSLIKKASLVINATDYDKEGEVIFFYLMKAIDSEVPFKRAHFTSQTQKGIQDAFKKLKSSDDVKNLTNAGRARSIADWVVGCNLTVAMSLKYSGNNVLSIGRVQTPTLTMLVERELAIRKFKSEPYFSLKAFFKTDKKEKFEAESAKQRIFDKTDAQKMYGTVIGNKGIIESIDSKEIEKDAPPLYNLSGLQMEANTRYGFTLSETLDIAQTLYESGYITYPRTDSQYLTEDMEPVIHEVLDAIAQSFPLYRDFINGHTRIIDKKKYFDNTKVSSHYAIIPTTTTPSDLSDPQHKIYDLIVRSVIMMIYPKAVVKKTKVITEVKGEKFHSKGSVIIKEGWMAIDKRSEEKILPELSVGQVVSADFSLLEKETEPPNRYTDRTLVASMISAGKELDDSDLRKVMQNAGNKGIGTEATRASIIDTLITRSYAIRKGKNIIPTERGISLIKALPLETIKSAELTAVWEERLENIANGKENMENFISDIEKATERWCIDIKNAAKESVFASTNTTQLKCPGCGCSIVKHTWGYGCSNYKNGCKYAVNNTIASKKLTDRQMEALITEGHTGNKPLAGFISKSGKKFEAIVTLNITIKDNLITECKTSFVFPHNAPMSKPKPTDILLCPSCNNPIVNGKWAWECSEECGFSLSYKIAGRDISEAEMRQLVNKGKTSELNCFISREGKYFPAALKLKEDKKGVEFVFNSSAKNKKK